MHRRYRGAFSVAVLVATVLLQSPAAQATPEFHVPHHCGSRELFDASIRARVDEHEAESILSVLALTIREQLETYTLTMQVGRETRSLQDKDCLQLFRAAVVVAIALWEAPKPSESAEDVLPPTMGHVSGVAEPNSAPSTARSGPTMPQISAPFGHVWVNSRTARRQYHVQLGAELGFVAGLQPEPGLFYGMRAALDAERFGVAGSIRWAPGRADLDANERGVEVSALGAHLVTYFKPTAFLGLEFGARADYLRGTGLGSRDNRSAHLWTFGPVIGAWATPLRLGSAFTLLGAEGHLPLLRPRFEIAGYGDVFRVAPLGAVAYLAIGYRF